MTRSRAGWVRPVAGGLGGLVVCLAIGLAWHAATTSGLVSRAVLPTPERTWGALVRGFTTGDLGAQTLATVERMLIGWVLASFVGVLLGALIGSSRRAREWLAPSLEFLRPLPASALIPVGIAFFGLSQTMVLAVVAFGSLWPMLLATIHGFAALDVRLKEVGRVLGFGRVATIWKFALPNALPDILAGMRLGLTVALILSVVGEMLAGQRGLGLGVLLAARAFRAPDLFAGVVILGAIGLATNAALSALERRALRWR
jgi:sulfonate transport system permease protein